MRRTYVTTIFVMLFTSLLSSFPTGARQRSPVPVSATLLVKSTFDVDDEGWKTDADASCRPRPCYAMSGGNPGGYIYSDDELQGTKFYFNAPEKFLGNKSAAYDQHLTFDMRQNLRDVEATNDADVILVGAGITLVFDTPFNPPRLWATYNVPLVATAGWRVGSITGRAPTEAEMRRVLTSLTNLRIRGDFIFGQATADLDNVAISTDIPPPINFTYVFLPLISTVQAPQRTFLPLVRKN